ncbi:OLC1v1022736C1 [Oldenlandia corymbosa var. corymbosa]|uniref:OLC1v1022736C1 n=1 Tax=Oldenlandia corymbosa var. corymbosa TaxID=529605 RepID=A0AAV1C152_OLDCO|nr:OLC1v1022736C1 [Oldenlandia corymbosa var. corymbosa]
MSLAIQTESSNASQVLPAKRRRGRPRKDRSLNQMGVAPVPPGFERLIGSRSRQSDTIDNKDGMVGQEVTGVIEASFDAGYLLAVRVGNSRTILRGVVFKPGDYTPVTSHNDVAPGAQMINRAAVNLPLHNQTQTNLSSIDRNGLYQASPQSASTVISKGKSVSLTAGPIITQVGARGNVVPVVLQPLGPSNGAPPVNPVNMDASASDGKDVVAAEPLAMFIPPAASASARQFQVTTNQPVPIQVQVQAGNQFPAGGAPIHTDSYNSKNNEVPSVMKEVAESQEVNPSAPSLEEQVTASQGSSESSEMNLDDDDEEDSSAGTSNTESDREVSYINSSSVPNLSTNHTTGRMTELLQALQETYENQKSRPVPFTNSGADAQEKENSEINPENERIDG